MTVHVPILVDAITEALVEPLLTAPEPSWIVDCTLGGGGHTSALLRALESRPELSRHHVLSVDQDPHAIAMARARFARELEDGRIEIVHSRFGEIGPVLAGRPVLGIMADLGFSSDQIEDDAR